MRFHGDIIQIKISSSEDSVSKTIEELLELNKGIPQRKGSEIQQITEKQFDEDDYANKDSRGEAEGITEEQFGKRKDIPGEILEIKLEETSGTDGGNRPEAWDKDEEEVRGHKNVSTIWHEVYRHEDNRKKLDKGQLDRNKK